MTHLVDHEYYLGGSAFCEEFFLVEDYGAYQGLLQGVAVQQTVLGLAGKGQVLAGKQVHDHVCKHS